jgi:hypothetical protein
MTITFKNMVDETLINLAGYTLQQDRSTYLKTAITTTTSSSASPLIVSLGSTDNVGKGIIEIDEELMWVDSYDRVSNTATIAPYGRGYLGTTPAIHSGDVKVAISPTFPRFSVKRAINDTINALSSVIYAVKTTTFTFNPAVNTYAFNNLGIKSILAIHWQSIGPSKEWIPVRHWDFDAIADSTTFGAGAQTVTLSDAIVAGRTVKVMYAANSTMFETDDDDYETKTGMPDSTKDLVILGASYRLLSFLDPARATMVSPQADETDSKRPYGSSGTAVKQIYALYQQRLQEETRQQQQNFPAKVHYSRR